MQKKIKHTDNSDFLHSLKNMNASDLLNLILHDQSIRNDDEALAAIRSRNNEIINEITQ